VRVEHDHCIEGLFAEEEWLEALRAAGFEAETYPPFEPEEYPGQRIFIGKKPR